MTVEVNHSSCAPQKSSHNLSTVKVNHRSISITSARGVILAVHGKKEASQAALALFSWFYGDFLKCIIYEFRLCSCPTQFLLSSL